MPALDADTICARISGVFHRKAFKVQSKIMERKKGERGKDGARPRKGAMKARRKEREALFY